MSPDDNSEQALETSDTTWIMRPSKEMCSNRYAGSDYQPMENSDGTGDKNDHDNDNTWPKKQSLEIIAIVLAICCVTLLGVVIYMGYQLKQATSMDSVLYHSEGYKLTCHESDAA